MRSGADIIKEILSKSEYDFCISDKDGIIFRTEMFADTSCPCLEFSIAAFTVRINVKGDLMHDASVLLMLAFDSLKQKANTLENLFDDMISKNINASDYDLRELKIRSNSSWMVIYISYRKEPEEDIKEILQRSLPKKSMIAANKPGALSLLLLLEVPHGIPDAEMIDNVRGLYQIFETEFSEMINIGISNISENIFDAKELMDQAKKAAFFGRAQKGSDGAFSYDRLGIAKIAANLTEETKTMLRETVVDGLGIDYLDNELIKTINVYFQNNLNVSETARNLYIHRNTLAYRLEKIQRITGLDLTRFDDAAFLRFILTLMIDRENKGVV